MKKTQIFGPIVYCLIIVQFFVTLPVLAYLDPGTGSYLLQILIASAVGALFAIKPFFTKMKEMFAKIAGKQRDDE